MAFFGALTPWSAIGLLSLFVIVTDDLTLRVASSRPLVPRVAVEAHSLATAQLMGRSSPSSISERAGAPRHSITHFFPVLMAVKKKKAEHDEQAP